MPLVAPSILAADFSRLGEEVKRVTDAGADYIHVDVMDGFLVPNITIGPSTVRSLRAHSKLPFIAHLMITHPERHVKAFAESGSDIIEVHVEAEQELSETLKLIKDWLGGDEAWFLNRWGARGNVPAATKAQLDKVKAKY